MSPTVKKLCFFNSSGEQWHRRIRYCMWVTCLLTLRCRISPDLQYPLTKGVHTLLSKLFWLGNISQPLSNTAQFLHWLVSLRCLGSQWQPWHNARCKMPRTSFPSFAHQLNLSFFFLLTLMRILMSSRSFPCHLSKGSSSCKRLLAGFTSTWNQITVKRLFQRQLPDQTEFYMSTYKPLFNNCQVTHYCLNKLWSCFYLTAAYSFMYCFKLCYDRVCFISGVLLFGLSRLDSVTK